MSKEGMGQGLGEEDPGNIGWENNDENFSKFCQSCKSQKLNKLYCKQTNQKIMEKTTPRDIITKLIKITVQRKILKWNFMAEQQVMWSPSLVRAGALAAPMRHCNAIAQHRLALTRV